MAQGSEWATTLTAGIVRVVCPVGVVICSTGCLDEEMDSATIVRTMPPITAHTFMSCVAGVVDTRAARMSPTFSSEEARRTMVVCPTPASCSEKLWKLKATVARH
jgi:hypothetical protein